MIDSGIDIPESVLDILKSAAEMTFTSYQNSVEGFVAKDVSHTNDSIDTERKVEELYKEVTPLPLFGNPAEASLFAEIISIRESLKKISHYAADIAELTIDRTYKFIEKT